MKVTLNSFSRISTSVLLASSLAFAVGCSDSDSHDDAPAQEGTAITGTSGDASTGAKDTTSSPIDCATAWKTYVKANPTGLELTYKITSETTGSDGAVISSNVTNSESKIVESNDEHVVTLSKVSIPGLPANESETEWTKIQFLESCQTVDGLDIGDASMTILEQSTQKITVAAGTFDTNYTKVAITSEGVGGESTNATWILQDGSNIVVKSETSVVIGSLGFTNHTVNELVKIVRP